MVLFLALKNYTLVQTWLLLVPLCNWFRYELVYIMGCHPLHIGVILL